MPKFTLIKTTYIDQLAHNYEKEGHTVDWINFKELSVLLPMLFGRGFKEFDTAKVLSELKIWIPGRAEYLVSREKHLTIYIKIKASGMFCNTTMEAVNSLTFDVFVNRGTAILRLCWEFEPVPQLPKPK